MNNKDFYLIDTHCHINIIIKKNFDVLLTEEETLAAQKIICDAKNANVKQIINVATSFIESQNCITLAQKYPALFSTIGIHPNDLAENWPQDFNKVKDLLEKNF